MTQLELDELSRLSDAAVAAAFRDVAARNYETCSASLFRAHVIERALSSAQQEAPAPAPVEPEALFGLRRYLDDVIAEGTANERAVALAARRMLATPPAPEVRAGVPAHERYQLTRSIIDKCPALKLPQSFLQQLGMTAQIVALKGADEVLAKVIVDALNASLAAAPPAEPAPERAADARDAERLDWMEQRHWDSDELFELVNNWVTQDGRRHPTGLRAAIDAALSQQKEHP